MPRLAPVPSDIMRANRRRPIPEVMRDTTRGVLPDSLPIVVQVLDTQPLGQSSAAGAQQSIDRDRH